ncbi:MAG: hypothetical protein P1V20_27030 [Verrucomicrobiales bacterium]|nr:hypothetical protein [Verrucomicrobiales bacterium]
MFCLAGAGFGFAKVAGHYPDSSVLQFLKFSTTHPQWSSQFQVLGFSLWDMIQPAFMFMVGVSMPYSYGKREVLGDSYKFRLKHAWIRALILVLLGVFLHSMRKPETNWLFTNVLSQIGLGYGFLFFLVSKSFRTHLLAGLSVLFGYFMLMAIFPTGLEGGIKAHFENGNSFPQKFDLWFLNLFPRPKPFPGHVYATLNFIPAFVTMLMGLVCGQLLQNDDFTEKQKLQRLFSGGLVCLVAGLTFGLICPIVKKLWTPSWTLFSGAYVIWLLAILYWVIDVKGWKKWTKFFVVVGVNSIAAYFMGVLMKNWTRGIFTTHLPQGFWEWTGHWRPFVESVLVVMFFWLALYWMYRNRVFVRV